MKNKNLNSNNSKIWFVVFTAFMCFVILTAALIFSGAVVLMLVKINNINVFGAWVKNANVFITDYSLFWANADKYNVSLVIISLVISAIVFIVLNRKFIFSKWFVKDKKHTNEKVWEFNAFDKENSVLSEKQFLKEFVSDKAGFMLGYLKKHKTYVVNKKHDVHSCVLGISGSGKSERVIVPNIYYNANLSEENRPCFVITDPKKEILERTGGVLAKNGYDIYVFDLNNADTSIKWNPLGEVWNIFHNKTELKKEDYANGFNLINEIVNSLPFAKDDGGIWISNAKNVLISIFKFLILYSLLENNEFSEDFYTLAAANEFLGVSNFKKGKWFEIVKNNSTKNEYWNKIYLDLKSFRETADDTLSGYMSNAINALSALNNDIHLKNILSKTTIKFDDLFKSNNPFAVFVCYPDHKETSQFIIPMLLSSIYAHGIDAANENKNKKLKRPLQFVLEEFASLPKVNGFVNWISIARSRQIFFMIVLQDFEQLKKYDSGKNEANAIKTQFGLVYFLETNNEQTLKSISETLGTKTVEKVSKTMNEKNSSETVSENKESVMSVSEIKFKNERMVIIIAQKSKPIAIDSTYAYEYIRNELYSYDVEDEVLSTQGWNYMEMKPLVYGEPANNQIRSTNDENEDELLKVNESSKQAKEFKNNYFARKRSFEDLKVNNKQNDNPVANEVVNYEIMQNNAYLNTESIKEVWMHDKNVFAKLFDIKIA